MASTPLRCSSPAFCLPQQPQSHPSPRSWGIRPYGASPRAATEGEQGSSSPGSAAGLCSSVFGEEVLGGESSKPSWCFVPPQFTMTRTLLSTGLRKFLPCPAPAQPLPSPCPAGTRRSPAPRGSVTPPGGCGRAVTSTQGLELTLVPPAGWGCAPSPWPWRWVPCSCSPSPSSATRCCSPSPTTTTSSGSTGPSSTVGARRVALGCRGLRVGAAPSGSSPYSVPPRPLELGLPLLQHVPCLPHALRVLLHRVRGLCGVQEGTWPHGACPPPCVPLPGLLLIPFPQGIMARVYETSVVLLLLTLLVLGMVWVASAIVGNNAASRQSLYGGCCQGSGVCAAGAGWGPWC